MTSSVAWLLIGLLPLLALAVAMWLGTRRWARRTEALGTALAAQRVMPAPTSYDPREIEGLPAPVQRFFRAVLTPGQPLVAAARLAHTGHFNLSEDGERWKPFTSRQTVVTCRPGFVWDARVAAAPGLAVHVHDAYLAGKGWLHAAVSGLVDVARQQGGGELARGELMRFLAEAAWYPTALLPSQGVRWDAVDDASADATLVDAAVEVRLRFRFDVAGHMASVRAEARGRGSGASMRLLPWEGRWSDHRVHEGMTLPFAGEVAWVLPQGPRPYWRGKLTALDIDWAS